MQWLKNNLYATILFYYWQSTLACVIVMSQAILLLSPFANRITANQAALFWESNPSTIITLTLPCHIFPWGFGPPRGPGRLLA
jgi:hypothetical protein